MERKETTLSAFLKTILVCPSRRVCIDPAEPPRITPPDRVGVYFPQPPSTRYAQLTFPRLWQGVIIHNAWVMTVVTKYAQRWAQRLAPSLAHAPAKYPVDNSYEVTSSGLAIQLN